MSKPSQKNRNIEGVTKKYVKPHHKNNLNLTEDVASKYFLNEHKIDITSTVSNDSETVQPFLLCCQELNLKLSELSFPPPVKCVYNPTEYAFDTFKKYVLSNGNRKKTILFLGMNPGPWGMSQTGVPFGEINAVRDWLKIDGIIGKPPVEEPSRPILGFDCHKSEVSGKRFWALAKHLSETPEKFFNNCFVHNYCPLQFIANGGKNLTPSDLKIKDREDLYKICDTKLAETIKIFDFKILIGIGRFAEIRLNKIVKDHSILNVQVCGIPHPSPRSVGNTDWQDKAFKHLDSLNLIEYFK